jgi:FMN phosphatase YigB (HAD superfamily)
MVGFAAEYGIALTAERAQDSDNLLEKFASEYALVFEDAILLATLLKSIGVKLAIVTDNLVGSAGSLVEKARRALNPDSVLISQASHFSKLNPAFPLVALTSLAVTPEDAWYVGDRLVEDGIWPSVYGVRTFVLCRNCQHIDPESNHLTSLTALPLPISVDRRR